MIVCPALPHCQEVKGARRNTGRVWEREVGTEMTVGWGQRDGASRAAVYVGWLGKASPKRPWGRGPIGVRREPEEVGVKSWAEGQEVLRWEGAWRAGTARWEEEVGG